MKVLNDHMGSKPLQAAQMERGMWQRYKIFILYMFYIMQNCKDHFSKPHIETSVVALK